MRVNSVATRHPYLRQTSRVAVAGFLLKTVLWSIRGGEAGGG